MPRSKNDPYKRKCAQAINHLSDAILAINVVYAPFLEQHPETAEQLKTIMLGINACREGVLMFINDAWLLDEESIKVYLG